MTSRVELAAQQVAGMANVGLDDPKAREPAAHELVVETPAVDVDIRQPATVDVTVHDVVFQSHTRAQ